MKNILEKTSGWFDSGTDRIAVAVLVEITGSGVRGQGAVMAISPDGVMEGSVSGGCIEAQVLESAGRVLPSGHPEVLRFCRIEDELLGTVSPCGGELTIAVTAASRDFLNSLSHLYSSGTGGSWGVLFSHNGADAGYLFAADKNGSILEGSSEGLEACGLAENGQLSPSVIGAGTGIVELDGARLFYSEIRSAPRLVIVGASHIGLSLAPVAALCGYRVYMVDPRSAFMNEKRLPEGIFPFKTWPGKAFPEIGLTESTAVAALTHDAKIDDQALKEAMDSRAFYIGALGSRGSHEDRKKRLAADGAAIEDINRIKGPIGLSLGAATPEEIAVAVMAEIIQEYRGKFGKV